VITKMYFSGLAVSTSKKYTDYTRAPLLSQLLRSDILLAFLGRAVGDKTGGWKGMEEI